MPSTDTKRQPQKGAERATQVKNSTITAESQDPVYNFWIVNRAGYGAPGAAHGTRRSRERAAKSGTQAGGLALPGSPSGAAGAGGKQGEPNDHGSSRDRRAASAGRPARAAKSPAPAKKKRGQGPRYGGRAGSPRARSRVAGPQRPPAAHALGAAAPERSKGDRTGSPQPERMARREPDGGSERPRSAQRTHGPSGGAGGKQGRPGPGERSDGAKRRTGAPKAGRGPRAPRDAPRGRGPAASAGPGLRKKGRPRRPSGPNTAEGLGARRRERPAGTGGAMCPGPRPGSIRFDYAAHNRLRRSLVCRGEGPCPSPQFRFSGAVLYLILGHYSVMARS